MVGQLYRHSPCGLPSVVGSVPRYFPHPLHPSMCDEEEAPRVHGPKARRKVRALLLQIVQPPGVVCTGPSGHGRQEGLLQDRSLHQATGVHDAQQWRDISRVRQQRHDRGLCNPRPQGTKKRKVVAAPSGSVPLKYRTVYHHGSTYPPQQPQQHHHQH
jgi:hypothetical protein